jgi:hypothetical protein
MDSETPCHPEVLDEKIETTPYELRRNIVKSIISFCDLIFSELPEKTRGDIIYYIHFYGFAAAIIYTYLFGGRYMFQAFLLVGVVIIGQLFLLRGCVLTKVEQHYRKEKGTTVDVFLRAMDIEITNENRKLLTLTGYSLIFLGAAAIYLRETLLQTRM